ncbi:hypothetical protein SteCoe_26170 [Stentor coeruleus]|uniref:Uncharacterized protein n=1 Tax=Stentor coeruleus TaxID=5963 RepID=A0A1R2BDK7_9CILI|nr:hypothetical protein SteCoe_26170 [Stentor coeruleus]
MQFADYTQEDLNKIRSKALVRRLLNKKIKKRISKTPYKSDSLQKRNVIIPPAPSTKKIVTPSLLKAMRGPPKIKSVPK